MGSEWPRDCWMAQYMFMEQNAGSEYADEFRDLLALAREDKAELGRRVEEVRDECRVFGIDTSEPGGLRRIDIRLNW